jgi:hypothetical protein
MGVVAEPITLAGRKPGLVPTTASASSVNLTQFRHLWYTISMKNDRQATLRAVRYQPLYPYERYYPYARIPGSVLT